MSYESDADSYHRHWSRQSDKKSSRTDIIDIVQTVAMITNDVSNERKVILNVSVSHMKAQALTTIYNGTRVCMICLLVDS